MKAKPTFYEFFAGGGMARAGLGKNWHCLFANDFDPKKVAAYKANWGGKEIVEGDIYELTTAQLPGTADLAWASFPCQDLSLAGNGAGLGGERSGTFHGFCDLVRKLGWQGRAPKLLVLENVIGILTSNGGRDFEEVCRTIAALGYVFGALVIDAVHFVPQSRPRFFLVAVRRDLPAGEATTNEPDPQWTPEALRAAHGHLRPDLKTKWRWWKLPIPPRRNVSLGDLLEENPSDVRWHSKEETGKLVSMMSDVNRAKLKSAMATKKKAIGTIYKRTRADENGVKRQRAELRIDGVSGCLRTPGGGSSRQIIVQIVGGKVKSRLLSGREAARLMGLPDTYELPANYNEAYHLLGDGLAVPVVRHLAAEMLAPLLEESNARLQAAE